MSEAMDLHGNWSYPTTVRMGAGRVAELSEAVRSSDMRRPLVVTDPQLAALPMIDAIRSALETAGLEPGLFRDVQANPVAANVNSGVEMLRSGQYDGVVAVGGGSALDAGKVIAFMHGQSRPIWDFEDIGDWWQHQLQTAGDKRSKHKPKRVIPKQALLFQWK